MHLKCTYFERNGKIGPELALIRSRRRMRLGERKRQESEKSKDRRPILERVCAAVMQSFISSTAKKY